MINLDHYPEELESLFAKISDQLAEQGIAAAIADEAAFAVTEFIREQWGGGRCYFTKKKEKPVPVEKDEPLFPMPEQAPPCLELAERDHFGQLAAETSAIFSGLGIDPAMGAQIAELVRADWAGQAVYINKGQRFVLARRDYAIWREWDGSYGSKMRLMRAHGITEVRFYQIVAAVRRREFKRTQPALPGVEVG